jgi:hypothetical protein
MRTPLALLISLACVSAAKPPTKPAAAPPATPVTGDYVECRTASVFAGACHYNGERVTVGRDAVMAWHVTAGRWAGTDLSGLRAVAALSCDDNLAESNAARRTELVVDGTPAQAAAFARLLSTRDGKAIGTIVSVRQGAVTFDRSGRAYRVRSDGFAELSVQPMPDDACCSQPSLVWYASLVPLAHRKVGFADRAAYLAGTVGDAWDRSDENDAFYGPFSL